MKNTKDLNFNRLCAMAIILIAVIALIYISYSGILTAQAESAQSPIGFEQKVYSNFDINDDFDDSCVIVVMDKFSSEFNKSHSAKFSKFPFVKAIKDLTSLTGIIKEKLYLNKNSFRQIIKIDLKERSKQRVLDAINQLQNINGVLWAGPNMCFKLDESSEEQPIAWTPPNISLQSAKSSEEQPIAMSGSNYKFFQWGLHGFPLDNGIHAPEAWKYSTGSNTVTVGVIDTGIAKHESLIDNLRPGWNFVADNDDTDDIHGHGTAVAGIIGATGNVENGVIGVCWNVGLVPLKAAKVKITTQSDGTKKKEAEFWSDIVVNAIYWAIDNDIDILNMSFGGVVEEEYVPFTTALSNYTGLVVCGACNDKNDNDISNCYPANYSHGYDFSNRVISVGAIDINGDIWNDPDYGSNYGANTVNIFAPGKKIMTTCLPEEDPSGYTNIDMRGTSLAAPHVVGAAVLLYSQYKFNSHRLQDSDIAAEVKSTILYHSTKDSRYDGKCTSGARLDAAEAIRHVRYKPHVMYNFGYTSDWYRWDGKVDLKLEGGSVFSFNENNELVLDYPMTLSFAVGSEFSFNAVTDILATLTFELRNSSGEIIPINGNDSHVCEVKTNILSLPTCTNNIFEINSRKLEKDRYTLTMNSIASRKDQTYSHTKTYSFVVAHGAACVADNSLITLADGSQVAVQDLTGDEELLVWNMKTGTFDTAPILFIDKEAQKEYEVTNLYFSDATMVKVIDEHGFWDFDLNQYVFLRNDATNYIGHWFNKQTVDKDGNLKYTKVQLSDVKVQMETTSAWSPITYGHLCYYVNGMLSMPGATTGFINIFEVDANTMKIDEESYLADIEKYGLFTYEEFTEICPVPKTIFEAVNGQYLKVAIGKGLTSIKEIQILISRYSKFW